jgi:S1-C subfamily serine protease
MTRASNVLSGMAGGAAVLLVGGVLAGTGVLGGDETSGERPMGRVLPAAQVTAAGGQSINQIYERVGPGVVSVEARRGSVEAPRSPFQEPDQRGGTATGSGFVLDEEGYILTNEHVVDGASSVEVSFAEEDGVRAELVGADASSDLALLKVDPDDADLTPLPLGDSDSLEVGDATVAIGNPFGLERTVTTGIVSALQRQIGSPNGFSIDQVIQTDAAINPGNSGGPLLDGEGRVIGINSQIATNGSQANSGVGFAVPVNEAKRVIPELKEDGRVERAYLGVSTGEVTRAAGRSATDGALIGQVTAGAPAARAGLRPGDVIVRVAGDEVTQPADVARIIAAHEPGESVEIEYVRGEERELTQVELGTRPEQANG